MRLGLDSLITDFHHLRKNKKIGILAHNASVSSDGKHILDLLFQDDSINITTLFGPEHGIKTKAQDMEPVNNSTIQHPITKKLIKVYSLYGNSFNSLSPTPEMLSNIETLIIDLQDIGSRYYTYIWTSVLCMKECAKQNINVIVCDRPNPINGKTIEGAPQEKDFLSFVGLYPLPVRHGMTIAEIARHINKEHAINCNLTVIPMNGWKREWFWDQTNLTWHNPSPNMRSIDAAILYPGMCLIEATNISEGRGTDSPFEIIGAPFIDSKQLIDKFNELDLLGIKAEPVSFSPAYQKWKDQTCNGVKWKVLDRNKFQPYITGIGFLWCVYHLYHNKGFSWRDKAYEFVEDIPAIDLLTGSTLVRENINEKSWDVFKRKIDGDLL